MPVIAPVVLLVALLLLISSSMLLLLLLLIFPWSPLLVSLALVLAGPAISSLAVWSCPGGAGRAYVQILADAAKTNELSSTLIGRHSRKKMTMQAW